MSDEIDLMAKLARLKEAVDRAEAATQRAVSGPPPAGELRRDASGAASGASAAARIRRAVATRPLSPDLGGWGTRGAFYWR